MVTGSVSPSENLDSRQLVRALGGFAGPAKAVVMQAHDEAYRYATGYVGTGHILLALVSDPACPIAAALSARAAGPDVVRRRFEQGAGVNGRQPPRVTHLPYSINAKSVLIGADCRARIGGSAVGRGHLWWALSHVPSSSAAEILGGLGQLDYVQRVSDEYGPDRPDRLDTR